MSEFKKEAIYIDESKINASIQPQENRIEYFQKIVDIYTNLGIEESLRYNDLSNLLSNPKEFIANRLIKEENINIGGLQLNFEKVFDIIEKPVGTDDLINKIINDRETRELLINHRNAIYFAIENGNTVVLNSDFIKEVTQNSTVYITTENEQKAYKILNILAENINELNLLKTNSHLKDIFWNGYFNTDNSTGNVQINPYFGKLIR